MDSLGVWHSFHMSKKDGVSDVIWEKHRRCEYNKDIRKILCAYIFELMLVNDVNKKDKNNIKKGLLDEIWEK